MPTTVLTLQGVSKIVPPGRTLLRHVSLSFFEGAKIGVVGLNGAGKSTLLRILAGEDHEIEGEVHRLSDELSVGYLPQEPLVGTDGDVRTYVEQGVADIRALLTRYQEIGEAFATAEDEEAIARLLEEQARVQERIEAHQGWDLEHRLEVAADALRLPPWDAPLAVLSGGERRRVALCRLLLSSPDVLLLDEPTNHLDADTVAWLERYLRDYQGTVILVTHDRYFLDNVVSWILEIDRGQALPFAGNYSAWLENKEERLRREERSEAAHRRALEEELAWVRRGARGRQAQNKARLQRYEELSSREFQKRHETQEIYIPPGPRLGDRVIEFSGVGKSYGDRPLYTDLSFRVPRGAIVGIIGPNGSGKSTLLRLVTGEDHPDQGTVHLGETVSLAYVPQERLFANPNATVFDVITDGVDMLVVGNYETPARGYVARFNFRGADQQKPVGRLAGGERNRVHLARVLRHGGNVLLLDEPTNDLDVETLRALEEALLAFPGSALVVSHDRWFLDRIATHLLVFDGDGGVEFFEGNYSEYHEKRVRAGVDETPHRPKFRRFQ
jgi:sulfate-transporting ATPase